MSKHNLSHADIYTAGDGSAFNLPDDYANALRGMPIFPMAAEEFPAGVEDRDAIAESQTPSLGGQQDLDLDGVFVDDDGVAILPYPTQVTVSSVGNDNTRQFTVLGTDANGRPQASEFTGSNAATASTPKHFLTVDRVFVDDDTAAAVFVGIRDDASVGLRMQSFSFDGGVNPARFGIGIENGMDITANFNAGTDDEQTAFNGSPRASYTRSSEMFRFVVLYMPNLSKRGVGPNYTDPSQTPSPF